MNRRVQNTKGEEYANHMTLGEIATFLGVDKKSAKRKLASGIIPPADVELDNGWRLWSPDTVDKIHRTHLDPKRYRRPNPLLTGQVRSEGISNEDFKYRELKEFWDFVAERHAVYYRRKVKKQLPPWTKDKVLQREFIVNMYRELDPATKWLNKYVLNSKMSKANKVFNIMFYRFIGSQEVTMAAVGLLDYRDYDAKRVLNVLNSMDTPFGDAYTVYANVHNTSKSKIWNVVDLFKRIAKDMPVIYRKLKAAPNATAAYKVINNRWGFGPFLSYQVYIDMSYAGLIPYTRNDFVIAGPGAKRGLNIILKAGYHKHMEVPAMKWLFQHQHKELDARQFKWLKKNGQRQPLVLSDIQNCLCEFQKYHRVKHGERGASTRRYRGGTG